MKQKPAEIVEHELRIRSENNLVKKKNPTMQTKRSRQSKLINKEKINTKRMKMEEKRNISS